MKFNIIRPSGDIHSQMFLELSELLHFSIQELGLESVVSTAEAKFGFQNIVLGVFYDETLWNRLPENSIILNTEPLFVSTKSDFAAGRRFWSEKLIELSKKFCIWDYDQRNIRIIQALGGINVQLLKFGFQKRLQRIPVNSNSDRNIDVLFYGSANKRREDILNQIAGKGLFVLAKFGLYSKERDVVISKSKIVINVHFHEPGSFEIVRLHYLLNNGVAIVPEINPTTSIDDSYLNCVVCVPYTELVERCVWLKENPDELVYLREKALTDFMKFPQVSYLEKLINKI